VSGLHKSSIKYSPEFFNRKEPNYSRKYPAKISSEYLGEMKHKIPKRNIPQISRNMQPYIDQYYFRKYPAEVVQILQTNSLFLEMTSNF
jgi:hypothetical protein